MREGESKHPSRLLAQRSVLGGDAVQNRCITYPTRLRSGKMRSASLICKAKPPPDRFVVWGRFLFGRDILVGGQIVQDEPEGRAHADGALYAVTEAVLLEDRLGDGQPQPGALLARI